MNFGQFACASVGTFVIAVLLHLLHVRSVRIRLQQTDGRLDRARVVYDSERTSKALLLALGVVLSVICGLFSLSSHASLLLTAAAFMLPLIAGGVPCIGSSQWIGEEWGQMSGSDYWDSDDGEAVKSNTISPKGTGG